MSNRFDTAIILDSTTYSEGTPSVNSSGYIGFGIAANGVASSGPRIIAGSGVPAINAPIGSIYMRLDSAQFYQATDAVGTWTQIGSISSGSIELTDNSANAFEFVQAGTPYLRFVTTNGAERNRSDVSWDFGATAALAIDFDIADNTAAALEFRAGASGLVMLGFNTINAAEILSTAATVLSFGGASAAIRGLANSASGLLIGSAVAPGMLTLNTTAAAELIAVTAASGMRLGDAIPLRFGSPGTDVVFTPDGTDLNVTGTGAIVLADNFELRLGTDEDGALEFASGSSTVQLRSNNVSGAGALAASANVSVVTGSRVTTDAAVGTGSGSLGMSSGSTDCTDAGGTGGDTGPLSLGTGSAASTLGTSGSTGVLTLFTGDSADVNSGDIVVQTGTAGATRGVLDINVATISLATQATDFEIIDNSNSALSFSQGASVYFGAITTNGSERVQVGIPVFAASTVAPMVQLDGADFTDRIVLVEDFTQRPAIAADIANNNASKVMEVIGTNSTSALAVFAAGGGVSLTTAGAASDQMLIRGNTTGADNSQSPWTGTNWSTSQSLTYKCCLRVVDTANIRIGAGMKTSLTAGANLIDAGTDADQAWFVYDNPGAGFGANSDTNWICHYSIGGVDSDVDTGVAVAAGNVRLVITIGTDRVCRFYLNGALVATTAALTAAVSFLPFVGIQQTAGVAARNLIAQRLGMSKLYAAA